MKKYLKQAYQGRAAVWIFGIIASLGILPGVLKTILLCIRKESLGSIGVFLADILCIAIAMLLSIPAAISAGLKSRLGSVWCRGILPCFAALCSGQVLTDFFSGRFETIGSILGYAIASVLLGIALCLLSSAASGSGRMKLRRMIPRMGVAFLFSFLCWYLIPFLFGIALSFLPVGVTAWSAVMASRLFPAALRFMFLMPALKYLCEDTGKAGGLEGACAESGELASSPDAGRSDTDVPDAAGEEDATKKNGFRVSIPAAVSGVILLASAVFIFPCTDSPVKRLEDEYNYRINKACYNLVAGDVVKTVKDYGDICRELEVWQMIADGENDNIKEEEMAENQVLAYLHAYMLEGQNRFDAMDRCYTEGWIEDTDFCFDLLSEYKKAEVLTPEQQNRRKEIIGNLASNGIYMGGLPDVKENAAKLSGIIEAAVSYQVHFDRAELLSRIIVGDKNGTDITGPIVKEAVDMAVANPDDFAWNFMAVLLYNNQYRRMAADTSITEKQIMTVTANFEKLFSEQLGDKMTDEAWLGIRQTVINTYMWAGMLDQCAYYGIETLKKTDDAGIRESTMYALLESKRYDDCLKLAKDTKDDSDTSSLYYAATAALGNGDFDTATDYALKLAKQVTDGKDAQTADELLYGWISRLVLSTQTTDATYNKLSEAQLEKLNGDEFMKNYLDAYLNAFTNPHNDQEENVKAALAAADLVLAAKKELCYPNYIKAVVYAQQEKHEDAVKAYRQAIEYNDDDAMIWFALYASYLKLEDWEGAYTSAAIAADISPWYDYYNDDLGVGIHMYTYRDAAKEKVKELHEASQKGGRK